MAHGIRELAANDGDYPGALPELKPLDVLRIAVSEELSRISGVSKELIFSSLETSNTLQKGDLLLATPKLRVKGVKPNELATGWAAQFSPSTIAGNALADGVHLRFFLSPQIAPSVVLPRILTLGDRYGFNTNTGLKDWSNPSAGRQRVVVEFSSPNIAKKFHQGHLRSTIIGAFLSNLFESSGYDVVRLNYLGDWGRQYGLLAIAWKRYGNESEFESNPIRHLFDIYVKISADFQPEEDKYKMASKRGEDTSALENSGLLGEAKTYFKRMEGGDEETLSMWRRFRALSIEQYKLTYSRLNIHFTEYVGESQVRQEVMNELEQHLLEKGVATQDRGATIVDFTKPGAKERDVAIIRNRNGTSNYLLRDIGAAVQRYRQYHMESMYYVVMSEQETHLRRLFKILELLGEPYSNIANKSKHISYGKIMGMSTRRGTVKFLDDVVADVSDFMHEVMRRNETKYAEVENPDEVARVLGISAIMVQDMSGKRIHNYDFSLERMTAFDGDTGPYLQYSHARLCSILDKAKLSESDLQKADFSLLTEAHAVDLVRLLVLFPDVITQTLKTLEPTTVLTFLFRLTHQLNSSYDVLRVINPPGGPSVGVARAALYTAARQTLRNGMVLLSLTPVDRM